MNLIENFEKLLADGRDDALLRFGLGQAYLKEGNAKRATQHLARAVIHDPGYSAAWKLLGKAHSETGDNINAKTAFENGIRAAEEKGDVQAAKEMKVFLKRLQREVS